ncbi:MAG TPA: hypothetical protein PLM79_09610 [Syntrophobacteraceae bacterium]|nr:hypothetical protein [Syntrophobacteraceae bacterium]
MESVKFFKIGRQRRFTLWFSLALSLWLVVGSAESAFLCFGANDHLRLEFLRDAGCNQVPEKAAFSFLENSSPASPSAGNDCGPCTDIALSITSALYPSAPNPIIEQQPLFADSLPVLIADCAETPGTSLFAGQQPVTSGLVLARLSSVVLLI